MEGHWLNKHAAKNPANITRDIAILVHARAIADLYNDFKKGERARSVTPYDFISKTEIPEALSRLRHMLSDLNGIRDNLDCQTMIIDDLYVASGSLCKVIDHLTSAIVFVERNFQIQDDHQ